MVGFLSGSKQEILFLLGLIWFVIYKSLLHGLTEQQQIAIRVYLFCAILSRLRT